MLDRVETHLEDGDTFAARRALAEARKRSAGRPSLRFLHAQARVLLAEGAVAAAALPIEEALTTERVPPDWEWRLELAAGRIERARQRPLRAVEHLERSISALAKTENEGERGPHEELFLVYSDLGRTRDMLSTVERATGRSTPNPGTVRFVAHDRLWELRVHDEQLTAEELGPAP